MRVLSPEQVRDMPIEQLADLIRDDLFVDAYAVQQKAPVAYRGRRLAQGLYNVLYPCPSCQSMGTLTTAGDTFRCSCGLEGTYAQTGMLQNVPFATIREWAHWQRQALLERALNAPDCAVIEDENQVLYSISRLTATILLMLGEFPFKMCIHSILVRISTQSVLRYTSGKL
jgi:hypothetical protein